MKQIAARLSYANVVSTLALFLILGGAGALAAKKLAVPRNSVGTKQLRRNAVSAEKIKTEAISTPKLRTGAVGSEKLAAGAVNASKLAAGAVGAEQLADGAVGAPKLDPSQRSEAIAFQASSVFDLFDSYEAASWTTVMSANLPAGNWSLTASLALSVTTAVPTHVACRMIQNGAVLAEGGTEAERVNSTTPALEGVALSGVTGSGGTVSVTCGDTLNGVSALQRSLVATRVGSVGAG
jgi:hypothetical protein